MDIRKEIIVRSEQLFMRLGVKSVTMDDVSRELGISKKTLYQHFENKDSLVEAVISTHVEREQDVMNHICQTTDNALDEMRTIGAFITATLEDVSASTLYDLQKYYRKLWELLTNKQDGHMIDCIMRNLERGTREGLYRNDLNTEIIAKIYAKATYMVVEELSNPNSKFHRKQLIWELHNYHVHAIASPEGLQLWKEYSGNMKYYEASTI